MQALLPVLLCGIFAKLIATANTNGTTHPDDMQSLSKSRGLDCEPGNWHPASAQVFCREQLDFWAASIRFPRMPFHLSTDPAMTTVGYGTDPIRILEKQKQNKDSITTCEMMIKLYRREDEAHIRPFRRRAGTTQLDDTTDVDEIVEAADKIIDGCLSQDMNGVHPLGKKDLWVLRVVGSDIPDGV